MVDGMIGTGIAVTCFEAGTARCEILYVESANKYVGRICVGDNAVGVISANKLLELRKMFGEWLARDV